MSAGVENLLFNYLRVQNSESMALIHDASRRPVAECIKEMASARGIGLDAVEIDWKGRGKLDPKASSLLASPEHSVVIISVVKSIWHTAERHRARYELKKRIASIVSPLEYLIDGPALEDKNTLRQKGEGIALKLKTGSGIRITSPSGTNITAKIGRVFVEDGFYDQPASGGNFPSGEVGFVPEIGSVNGVICYDVKFKNLGKLEKGDLVVEIENDAVRSIQGRRADDFRAMVNELGEEIMNIGEVAFGTNPMGVVRDDPTVIEVEKKLGTAHFGHGLNLGVAAKSVTPTSHVDGVYDDPALFVDGEKVL